MSSQKLDDLENSYSINLSLKKKKHTVCKGCLHNIQLGIIAFTCTCICVCMLYLLRVEFEV